MMRRILTTAVLAWGAIAFGSERVFYAGADVSMLWELEKGGVVYRSESGKAADAIQTMAKQGCNLFRLRLFVNPTTDFKKSWGATQDFQQVVTLAKRVKAAGQPWLLDIHYSDTWADPQHQTKPAAWKDLPFDQLKQKVHDYTAETLAELDKLDLRPDMVQVGNEITVGMLWPEGKLDGKTPEEKATKWNNFRELISHGISAVREVSKTGKPIKVMIHIHGGGKKGSPKWFFGNLAGTDYDIVGLSYYPAWGDDIEILKSNLKDLEALGKPVILAETSYPWREMTGLKEEYLKAMDWPMSKDGQVAFMRDLTKALKESALGEGYIWWYPEAVPTPSRTVWRGGAEALFDEKGIPLPGMSELRQVR